MLSLCTILEEHYVLSLCTIICEFCIAFHNHAVYCFNFKSTLVICVSLGSKHFQNKENALYYKKVLNGVITFIMVYNDNLDIKY